jgi:hypothetical protein
VETRWLLLLITQPTGNAALRMRIWREMKARGAGSLRDGVYLLPDAESARAAFDLLAEAVRDAGGSAHVVAALADPQQDRLWQRLFDRSDGYAALFARCQQVLQRLASVPPELLRRQVREIEGELAALVGVDFFPGDAQKQLTQAVADLRAAVERVIAPDEPRPTHRLVRRQPRDRYVGRLWATRRELWIDRAASAWLIRRFIDPQARFVWLRRPTDKPARAIGFDFNGAEFTHVDGRVTFEVLLASFALDTDVALLRLGAIVHALDAGGAPIAEASGFEALLTGLRALHTDDDAFLTAAGVALDAFYAAFGRSDAIESIRPEARARAKRTAK